MVFSYAGISVGKMFCLFVFVPSVIYESKPIDAMVA